MHAPQSFIKKIIYAVLTVFQTHIRNKTNDKIYLNRSQIIHKVKPKTNRDIKRTFVHPASVSLQFSCVSSSDLGHCVELLEHENPV